MSAALIRRHLWLDELATYYISGAPSFHRMFEALGSGIDYNPPLIYLITRAWQFVVGPDETLSRIPVAAAFFLASIGVFLFLKPRINSMWATCAVLMFWSTPSFYFATELRPYALVLMFFSFVLLGLGPFPREESSRRACLHLRGKFGAHAFSRPGGVRAGRDLPGGTGWADRAAPFGCALVALPSTSGDRDFLLHSLHSPV